jgi:hypothetical protein
MIYSIILETCMTAMVYHDDETTMKQFYRIV